MTNLSVRIGPDELRRIQDELVVWRSPEEFAAVWESIAERVPPETLFNQGGLAFLRDAYVASVFGTTSGLPISKIHLVDDQWPDFEIKLSNGIVQQFEMVEADQPGRRRGVEYLGVRDDEVDLENVDLEPLPTPKEAVQNTCDWLRNAVARKLAKSYSDPVNLAIYLNLEDWGGVHAQVIASFAGATRAGTGRFESIWVIWKKHAYRVHQTDPD
ncbi:hypothetical protein [Nisaea sp.]|uniref:hypothetical protein n=1 Tax=Nisaea sp. TaxID=2024842 RepID=UPI002B266A29|nr:hypothetical protein [Nisaea sp.]